MPRQLHDADLQYLLGLPTARQATIHATLGFSQDVTSSPRSTWKLKVLRAGDQGRSSHSHYLGLFAYRKLHCDGYSMTPVDAHPDVVIH